MSKKSEKVYVIRNDDASGTTILKDREMIESRFSVQRTSARPMTAV